MTKTGTQTFWVFYKNKERNKNVFLVYRPKMQVTSHFNFFVLIDWTSRQGSSQSWTCLALGHTCQFLSIEQFDLYGFLCQKQEIRMFDPNHRKKKERKRKKSTPGLKPCVYVATSPLQVNRTERQFGGDQEFLPPSTVFVLLCLLVTCLSQWAP